MREVNTMKIGLYNLEPHIINTAMMQVSQYHKSNEDQVEFYNHFFPDKYDLIYAFSIFDFTDKGYVTKEMICGGTGFDIKSRLPSAIEESDYDWSLYPKCDYSILWFSRGCNCNHSYCVVPDKEGRIVPVLPKNLNPNGKYIKVQDNNFFQNPLWEAAITYLKKLKQPVTFEGIDVRLLNKKQCEALNSLKHQGYIHIAWDNPKERIDNYIKKVIKWIKPYRFMCYVLIGYNTTEKEDLYRIETLRELKVDPFVMPYNKKDLYQRSLARYVNCKEVFKSCTWEEYKYKNGK